MTSRPRNPFDVTKASDFSDEEIRDTWVDSLGQKRLVDWVSPRSPMPMFILGGKGSGKTHLMRYMSASLQKLRSADGLLAGMRADGFIGVFVQCSGLNAGRFNRKGLDTERWHSIFAQYMDLWLAQRCLDAIELALSDVPDRARVEASICARVQDVFRFEPGAPITEMSDISRAFRAYQREIDDAVNNAALTRSADVSIHSSPGDLVFEIPAAFVAAIGEVDGLQMLYLIDEFENLDETPQKYVNTLLRERRGPCSFRIGSRTWGVLTHGLVDSREENKRGSEYEVLHLDEVMREKEVAYSAFCSDLAARRLIEAGIISSKLSAKARAEAIRASFEQAPRSEFAGEVPGDSARADESRPYLTRLRQQLAEGRRRNVAWGVNTDADIKRILNDVSWPNHPLIEKASILLLYQDWSRKHDLIASATEIRAEARRYQANPDERSRLGSTLSHYRSDLIAQLRRDFELGQRYLGFDTFVALSGGLPRNLLILLKYVYQWALYNGEVPFVDKPISEESQRLGVIEATNWFFGDIQVRGDHGDAAIRSILRIGTLLRSIRYSDKPAECSLIAFSFDASQLSTRAAESIRWLAIRSVLVPIRGGQRDRNTERVDEKYQLSSMLCPRWDLPVFRRGTLAFSASEVSALFEDAAPDAFDKLLATRIGRMTAPMFGKKSSAPVDQPKLPGLSDA